jgi:two-component system LytT family sensor kinase
LTVEEAYLYTTIFVLAVLLVYLYYRYSEEEQKRDKLSKENARLVAQNAMLEAEQLKFQLQPHTLNNILANLKAVASKLHRGMDALSETLEYILYKGKGHLVSVEDELIFIRQYLQLNEMFLNHFDAVRMDDSRVDGKSQFYRKPCIPHLVTGYLLENAFKHGDVRHADFMRIRILLKDEWFEMEVVNKVREEKIIKTGGVGLTNMRKRLDLLVPDRYDLKQERSANEYSTTITIKLR